MPTTIDIESQRMLLGTTPVRKIYQGTNLLGARIAELFAGGEQGVWYDPSDLSTLFQDAAGTVPVTGVEQPVGLMLDKSRGLVLGPELVTNGDFSNGTTGWVANIGSIAVTSGELAVTDFLSRAVNQTPLTTVNGRWYQVTGTMRKGANAGDSAAAIRATTSSDGSSTGLLAQQDSNALNVNVPINFYFLATSTATYIGLVGNGEGYFDNISVRELPGNHAYQTTATSRPVLSARVNLLTKTEDLNGGWTNQNCTLSTGITDPDGGTTAVGLIPNSGSNPFSGFYQVPNFASGLYVQQWLLKRGSKRYFWITTNGGSTKTFCDWDTLSAYSGNTVAFTPLTGGWYIVTATGTQGRDAGVYACDANNSITCVGDGATVAIYCCKPSLVPANHSSLPYQRVNTATDYDTAGFPLYLRCDGVDDGMVTSSIDFTHTDKVTVCAGVRKLSDAAYGAIAEIGTDPTTLTATFALSASTDFGDPLRRTYGWGSRGSGALQYASATNFPQPVSNVVSGIGDISAPSSILHVNGTQAALNTSAQGTGNYGNYPLYLFRRGGTTSPFNGRFYGMTIVGRLLSASEQRILEQFLRTKSRAY